MIDVEVALLGGTGLGVLSSATYVYAAIEEMETKLRIYYEKTKFPTVYSDTMILNPRVKLTLFEEETWDDIDASHYTNGCHQQFLDAYLNKPLNSASASVSNPANPRPAANHSAQTAFYDDVEYQAQRSVKRR